MDEFITIELFGQPFTFKADAQVTQAKAVAQVLEGEVRRVQQQHPQQPSINSKLTILMSAALNIANENIQLKQSYKNAVESISKRSERLLQLLDDIGP